MDKEILLQYLNNYLATATLIGFIVLIMLSVIYLLRNKIAFSFQKTIFNFINKYSLLFGFFLTLFATLLSLIYSEYLGVTPCGLCWLQRVFIYSQVIIFAVALIKNDTKVFIYSFWLSIVGGIIALYQEYLQLGYSELIPCPAISNFADCAKPTFFEYGFITFPFASIVLFGFLILMSLIASDRNK